MDEEEIKQRRFALQSEALKEFTDGELSLKARVLCTKGKFTWIVGDYRECEGVTNTIKAYYPLFELPRLFCATAFGHAYIWLAECSEDEAHQIIDLWNNRITLPMRPA